MLELPTRGRNFVFRVALFLLLLGCGWTPALAQSPPLSLASGDIPLLIVAGHGGKLPLEGAEIREKGKVDDPHFVLFGDAFTNELASDLASAVGQSYGEGHRPSLLLNQIHRRYADVNRTPELTSHDAKGVAHHAAFHQAIDEELERLLAVHGWAILIDVHGQARYETTLLLGTGENSVVEPWSLEALWGSKGVVDSLHREGFTVEPSTADGKQRYGGGYTIRHHGQDPRVEAWQMEHSRAIRDTVDARTHYLETLADVLARQLKARPRP